MQQRSVLRSILALLALAIAGLAYTPPSAADSSSRSRRFLSTIDGTVFDTALNEDVHVQGRVRLEVEVSRSRHGTTIEIEVEPVGLVAVGLTSDERFVASGEAELSYTVPVFSPGDQILFLPPDPILFSLVFSPGDPVSPISVPLGLDITFNSSGAAASAQVFVANPGCGSP